MTPALMAKLGVNCFRVLDVLMFKRGHDAVTHITVAGIIRTMAKGTTERNGYPKRPLTEGQVSWALRKLKRHGFITDLGWTTDIVPCNCHQLNADRPIVNALCLHPHEIYLRKIHCQIENVPSSAEHSWNKNPLAFQFRLPPTAALWLNSKSVHGGSRVGAGRPRGSQTKPKAPEISSVVEAVQGRFVADLAVAGSSSEGSKSNSSTPTYIVHKEISFSFFQKEKDSKFSKIENLSSSDQGKNKEQEIPQEPPKSGRLTAEPMPATAQSMMASSDVGPEQELQESERWKLKLFPGLPSPYPGETEAEFGLRMQALAAQPSALTAQELERLESESLSERETPRSLLLNGTGGSNYGPLAADPNLAKIFSLPAAPWDVLEIPRVPSPPMLKTRVPESWPQMLVSAYIEVIEKRYPGTKCWAYRRLKRLREHKSWSMLMAAAEKLDQSEIPPMAWVMWSEDIWDVYSQKNPKKTKKTPPPLAWIFMGSRLEDRRAWFERENKSSYGGTVVYSPEHEAFSGRWESMQSDLFAGMTPPEAIQKWFPNGLYQRLLSKARTANASVQESLNAKADAGVMLWT